MTTLEWQAPGPPVSINETRGAHWATARRALTPWGRSAWAFTHNAIIRDAVATGFPVELTFHLPFRTNQRRDPHNYTGTVVKAMVDGMVKAGLVPDDTAEWVTVHDPILYVAKPWPRAARVRVTITERSPV